MRQVIFVGAVVIFLAVVFAPRVQGDGTGYFAYLHSIVVDHDLNMSDEYTAAQAVGVHTAGDTRIVPATGLPANQFPVGPAILSLPFYLLALTLRPSGQPQFAPPFTFAFTLASLLYAALALALIYVWLRRLSYSLGVALAAITAVALSTPFFYYFAFEPGYSHTFSAFMVTAFLYVWWTSRGSRGIRGWLALGLIGGLMALVRWQDAPLMLVTLLDVRQASWRLLLQAPGALLLFSPQLAVDKVIFGRFQPGANAVAFSLWPGHYLQVLFSSLHGLFVWSPVLVIAVAGYWFVPDRALRVAFAICFLITLGIIGSFVFWYGGASFGMRFFINMSAFFAIGLAAIAARLRPAIVWAAVALFAAWNFVLVLNFAYLQKADVDPGYIPLITGQMRSLQYLPHLMQGYVIRALLLRSGSGLAAAGLLAGEALVVIAAVLFARRASSNAREVTESAGALATGP